MARGGRGLPVCPWASMPVVMRGGSWGASPGWQVRTKGLVKYRVISAKRNMFTVKAKPLLLSTFTSSVRTNLLYWEPCVTSTRAIPLSLFCFWYSSVGGHVQQRAWTVHPKCDIRFWEAYPCTEGWGKLRPGPGVLTVPVWKRSVGAPGWFDRRMWGYCAVCEGLGQGAVWTTKSQGFPPLGVLFPYVLCFCCAGKLCYTEDRIGLDEEGRQ